MAAALVVHGTVLGTVHAIGVGVVGEGFNPVSHDKSKAELADVDLKTGCVSDVYLAAAARESMCLAPWNDDVDGCLDEAAVAMYMDLSSCMARNDKNIATVAMLEPRNSEKVKSIDPEPLLEAMQQQKQPPKPPPPVPPPQPQNQPSPPPPPPAPPRPMQVVENAKPNEEKEPDNARFLAEYNTKVDKQTVARGTPKEAMIAKSKPGELTPKQNPEEASVKEHPDRDRGQDKRAPDVPGSLAMRTPGAPAPSELKQDAKTVGQVNGATGPLAFDGFVPRKGDGAIEQQRHDQSEEKKGQSGAGGGAPDVPNLKPSQDVLERALGGGNVDHMEEVDNGDETALNAKRWVYASFFNRLKRQVAQNWDPASVWRRSDPTGQVYGYKTRVTEVRVSLSPNGSLAKIVVTGPSGVGELDDEAVRAFHAAAPFPNPPRELVTKDDLITFAFSFYFEIGSPHTSWRVIRSM